MGSGSFVNATVTTEDTALASAPAPFLVSIAEGGTGATTASAARTNLGILDYIYPVGSIYMSTASTSPATLFGGTWTQLQGRFLVGVGSDYDVGDTGGEAEHTLTDSELPVETGSVIVRPWGSGAMVYSPTGNFNTENGESTTNASSGGSSVASRKLSYSFGGGQAHNNLPPYLAVYMWERTA